MGARNNTGGRRAVILIGLLAAACATPLPSAAPTSTPVISAPTATPAAAASAPTAAARNFEVDLPEGWLSSDLDHASLLELAAAMRPSWPAVSDGLSAVAGGDPGPFHDGTRFLAYSLRPEDLAEYPTGMNVVERSYPTDPACVGLSVADDVTAAGLRVASSGLVALAFGSAWRVAYTFDAAVPGIELAGETWTLSGEGASYQPYFETRADLHERYAPVFEGIMRSFRERSPSVAPSVAPGQPFGRYPHHDLALEALMPRSALGRPLCTWSIDGADGLAMAGQAAALILEELDLPDTALTIAVAGRVSTTLDPPYIASLWQFEGAALADVAALFAGWPSGDLTQVAGLTVYLVDMPDTPSHAEGQGYMVPVGNRIYMLQAGDPAWMRDVAGQIAAIVAE